MSTAKVDSKKIRRAVADMADDVREAVAQEIVAGMMLLPFRGRLKWAVRILRGIPTQESWASWAQSVVRRASIEIVYWAKKAWLKLRSFKPEYVPDKLQPSAVNLERNTATVSIEDAETKLNWLKKDNGGKTANK